MWTTDQIRDWLRSLGVVRCDIESGPYFPPSPDQLVVVTKASGPGFEAEGVLDTGGFQIRCRGDQGYNANGEINANLLDRAVAFADFPMTVGGVRIVKIQRSGGPPSLLAPLPDDAERLQWVCTYLPTIAS